MASSSGLLPPLTALSLRSGNRSLPSKARTWPGTLTAGHGPDNCEPVSLQVGGRDTSVGWRAGGDHGSECRAVIEKASAPGDTTRAAQEDHDSVIGLIRELVRIPSRAGADPYGPVLECASAWLDGHGLRPRLLSRPGGETVAMVCEISGGEPGPRYVLDACLDTAPYHEGGGARVGDRRCRTAHEPGTELPDLPQAHGDRDHRGERLFGRPRLVHLQR